MKKIRLQRGMSKYRLALTSDISQSHITAIERGNSQPSFYVLRRLLDCLGMSLSEFFCDEDVDIIYPSPAEREMIELIRGLKPESEKALLEFIRSLK